MQFPHNKVFAKQLLCERVFSFSLWLSFYLFVYLVYLKHLNVLGINLPRNNTEGSYMSVTSCILVH